MTRELWISKGRSRFDTKWKNEKVSWGAFTARLQSVTRTPETQREYMAMSKDEQDRIKDIGGFVLGMLTNGRRSATSIKLRSAVTLDADYGTPNLIDEFEMLTENAAAIYTTHKHTPKAPRFRLIFPLSRDVTPDEYECIARTLAQDYGIDYFDDTTYQPSRLMYWPSASMDAEYITRTIDGEFIDPDEILARYPDWHDLSVWPRSSRVEELRVRTAKKAQDPREKSGVIGAFCRQYTMQEAIDKFLANVYTPVANNDLRYTFTGGSTSGGLVIYDDVFAYSNHSTDPAAGQLCNAFDLIRIHYYRDKDKKADADTPTFKLPSYVAMTEFASNDPETAKAISRERNERAIEAFDNGYTDEEDALSYELDSKGHIKDTATNVVIALKSNTSFNGVRLDRMSGIITVSEALPWGKSSGVWTQYDDAHLAVYLENIGKFSERKTRAAIYSLADSRSYHPIEQYLESLPPWDGIPRAETLFVDYLGAEDTTYVRDATRKWLLAAVSRVYQPGCKYDTLIVLVGGQGIGKSMLLSKIGMKWFTDSLHITDMQTSKTGYEKIQGFWIVELGELAGMKIADQNALKGFISATHDNYRGAYSPYTINRPRSCVFAGTTNDTEGFLTDLTGNRRYLPIDVDGDGKLKPWLMTQDDVDQLWAEVLMMYEFGGEDLVLSGEALAEAEAQQTKNLYSGINQGLVEQYLDELLPDNWYTMTQRQRQDYFNKDEEFREKGTEARLLVSAIEIWTECLGRRAAEMTFVESKRIKAVMRKLPNWTEMDKRLTVPGYGRQRYFAREGYEDWSYPKVNMTRGDADE